MTTAVAPPPVHFRTVADLLHCLGDVPLDRVRLDPPPGRATAQDVLDVQAREGRLCELVDGILVEKPLGYPESQLASLIIYFLQHFVIPRNLGMVTGEAGTMRLFVGTVRIPDVAFTALDQLPGRRRPPGAVPAIAPDLAVEVLSASNTAAEMARKRREYFQAGVRLVWEFDPVARTVAVYTSPDGPTVLTKGQTLDGGEVLAGFTLSLQELFEKFDLLSGNVSATERE